MTAICITYNPDSRKLRTASAGYPAPLRLETGDELPIPVSGRALGLARTVGCGAMTEQLSPGAGLLLYTDGLTEGRGQTARYGIARAMKALRDLPRAPPTDLIAHLVRVLHGFADPELTDAICLIALRAEDQATSAGERAPLEMAARHR